MLTKQTIEGASQIVGHEVSQVQHVPFLPLPKVRDQTQRRVSCSGHVAPLRASVLGGAHLWLAGSPAGRVGVDSVAHFGPWAELWTLHPLFLWANLKRRDGEGVSRPG